MADYVKLHTDALDNRKIQTLPDELVKPWLNLILVARLHGGYLPDLSTLAFRLRRDQATVAGWLSQLRKAELIDQEGSGGDLRPHDWDVWNPPALADRTNAERQKRWREKKALARNGVTPISPTPPKEIQDNSIQPNKGVTPLRNETVTPLRNAVTEGMAEWPEAAIAIRAKFPAASDLEVLAIVQECVQTCISIDAEPPDDDDIAGAVKLAHFNGQENVRAYRKRASQVIKTWIERKKHGEHSQPNGKR